MEKIPSPKDWAQELINKLLNEGIDDSCDATRAFCAAYQSGDTMEAYEAYYNAAERKENFDQMYVLLIFPDRSCFADWKQEEDKFFLDINDLIYENFDVRKRLEPN
jgi:hypothetical protein